jgi:hypothetical protein
MHFARFWFVTKNAPSAGLSTLVRGSFTIQIPRLRHDQRSKLEEVLEVFSQDNSSVDLHNLVYSSESKNPLVKKIVKRLSKAASDEKIKRTIDFRSASQQH